MFELFRNPLSRNVLLAKRRKEVIDYVKDLRTGKITKQKKLKPVGLGSNTCIIEMFEGKKKVKEAVTHKI